MSGASVAYSAEQMEDMQRTQRINAEVQKRMLKQVAVSLDPAIQAIMIRTDLSITEKETLCKAYWATQKLEISPDIKKNANLASKFEIKTPSQIKAEEDARIEAARAMVPVTVIRAKGQKRGTSSPKQKGVIDLSSGILEVSDKPKKEKVSKTVVDLSSGILEVSDKTGRSKEKFTFTLYAADNSTSVVAVDKANEAFPKIKEALSLGGYVKAQLSKGVCLTLITYDKNGQVYCHSRKWFANPEKAREIGNKVVSEGIAKCRVNCRNCQGMGRVAQYTINGYKSCLVCDGDGKVDSEERIVIRSYKIGDEITRADVISLDRAPSSDPLIPSWRKGPTMHVNKTNGQWVPKCGTTRVTFSKG